MARRSHVVRDLLYRSSVRSLLVIAACLVGGCDPLVECGQDAPPSATCRTQLAGRTYEVHRDRVDAACGAMYPADFVVAIHDDRSIDVAFRPATAAASEPLARATPIERITRAGIAISRGVADVRDVEVHDVVVGDELDHEESVPRWNLKFVADEHWPTGTVATAVGLRIFEHRATGYSVTWLGDGTTGCNYSASLDGVGRPQ